MTKMPHCASVKPDRGHQQEHDRQQDQAGHLEQVQQPAPADDHGSKVREQDAAGEPADLLIRLHAADRLLLSRACQARDFRQSPGTMRGICWMAPNAAAYAHAIMTVVTMVVRRNCGWNSSAKLGRCRVPARFFSCHAGDSGRNGRMSISGIAGMTPDISV